MQAWARILTAAAAVSALRAFLNRGGTLFANNGLGLKTFDAAARRELKRILPDAQLAPIPQDLAVRREANFRAKLLLFFSPSPPKPTARTRCFVSRV